MRSRLARLSLALFSTTLFASGALASSYAVDSLSSSVDLGLSITVLGVPLAAGEQFPGSLSTTYGGDLAANTLDTAIGFDLGIAGADADVQPSNLIPAVGGGAGSAPGDYGAVLDATLDVATPPVNIPGIGEVELGDLHTVLFEVAVRDIIIDASSDYVSIAAGAFDASQVSLGFLGTADIHTVIVIEPANFIPCIGISAIEADLEADLVEFGVDIEANCPLIGTKTISVSASFSQALDSGGLFLNSETAGVLTAAGNIADLTLPVGFDITGTDLGFDAELAAILDPTFSIDGILVGSSPTECSDGVNNDTDIKIDLSDPGCTSSNDISEQTPLKECDDGLDNDGDGLADVNVDPGCVNEKSNNEAPACNDGMDNDGNPGIDFDGGAVASQGGLLCLAAGSPFDCCTGLATGCEDLPGNEDPQCTSASKNKERIGCGLGLELALLLPGLAALRRRKRHGA